MSEPQAVHIGGYDATLRDIRLPKGLLLSEVRITGAKLELSKDPNRIASEECGNVRVEVLESALTEFVGASPPAGVREIRIRIAEGQIHFEAIKTVLIDLKVKAICNLTIVDEKAVYIELVSVDVAGVGLRQFVQSHIDKINPVITTDALPVPARLQRIDLADGKLVLLGTVGVHLQVS